MTDERMTDILFKAFAKNAWFPYLPVTGGQVDCPKDSKKVFWKKACANVCDHLKGGGGRVAANGAFSESIQCGYEEKGRDDGEA